MIDVVPVGREVGHDLLLPNLLEIVLDAQLPLSLLDGVALFAGLGLESKLPVDQL